MRKRRPSKYDTITIVVVLCLIVIVYLLMPKISKIVGQAEIKKAPTTPPTFHEFYGGVTCNNGQDILNGHQIIGILGSSQYSTQITNGAYHLFVENGNNGDIIDFYIDNENINDETFQSYGGTQKDVVLDNIYCSASPGVSITIPINNQQYQQNSVDVTFTSLNFNIGSLGENHLHFYLDSDTTPYMFYNGITNNVQYNSIPASNAQRLSSDSFRISALSETTHTLRLVLANSAHTELTNNEATDTVTFAIVSQAAPPPGCGGGGGGGGGGGSRTRAQCEDGRDNDNDTKKDYPIDPGCSSRSDENEVDPISIVYRCDDGIDNDRDSLIDLNDSGCINRFDNSEENVNLNQNETEPEIPVIPNKTYEDKTAMKIIISGALIVIVLITILLVKIFREKKKVMG